MTIAPAQLPLTPRPLPQELFSSWLLRVAAANCTPLNELLDGFDARYSCVPGLPSLDFGLTPLFLQSISIFCRAPVERIRVLDLSQRVPHLGGALLLRFTGGSACCPRAKWRRLAYAFCPLCIAEQSIIHIRWEWCFACISQCGVHGTPLQFGCASCGESDPLTFGPSQSNSQACWSCGGGFCQPTNGLTVRRDEHIIKVIEDAYRAALLGVAPDVSLFGKATDRAFRRFVEDMLQLLVRCTGLGLIPDPLLDKAATLPRQPLLDVIADLIANAVPSSNVKLRRLRCSRSLQLWTALMRSLPQFEGQDLEKASQRWPIPLQRRFASALRRRKQESWPYTPYQGKTACPRFTYSDTLSVCDLSAVK